MSVRSALRKKMARFITRECPKCGGFFRLAISPLSQQPTEFPITAWCAICGYCLDGWRVILGRKPAPYIRHDRVRKVFR